MNGLLLINKEKDFTSRDIVNIVGRELNTKQVGHTGTLDPMATGVLVLCVGSATKLVEMITSTEKEYIAEITLGIKTNTLDITGKILEQQSTNFNNDEIKDVLSGMIGTYDQEVPAYSAVKIAGRKLYEYARNNEEIALPKRQVTVKSLELISDVINTDSKTIFTVKTLVSKGTYIRSLVNDIAIKLSTIGVMSELKRTRQGLYKIEDCYSLDDIKNKNYKLISIKDCLPDATIVVIDDIIKKSIMNGNVIDNVYGVNEVLFINELGLEVALYHEYEGKLKPYKMF